jgi:pre-mRNA-splicing factor 38B|tara:strand:- start:1074 stop:2117 length:1044 start_codon:yes stop_codon:yes gene_type:complete
MSRSALARYAHKTVQLVESGDIDDKIQIDVGNRKDSVELKINSSYNFHQIVWTHLHSSFYFRSLHKCKTFSSVVDKIYYDVDHCEPLVPSTRGVMASSCFCLVHKLQLMRLTTREVHTLLTHKDSPYLRVVGLLYLRISTNPNELWHWFEPLLRDQEEFRPTRDSNDAPSTISTFVQQLLASNKYFDTILPPIPIPIMRLCTKKIQAMSSIVQREYENQAIEQQFRAGMIIQAMYSDDYEWYDARIERRTGNGTFLVTYLPEDEYGNQEERSLGYMRLERIAKRNVEQRKGGRDLERATGGEGRERERSRSREGRDGSSSSSSSSTNNKPETAWQRKRREMKEKRSR